MYQKKVKAATRLDMKCEISNQKNVIPLRILMSLSR